MTPDITVLMPAYNHARYVGEAIASVLAQTICDRLRIIVSDDSSSDDTLERAQEASRNAPNVTVLQTPSNLGVMQHYRWLTQQVDTPFTAILETDDTWINPRKLELQLALLERLPNVGGCFSAYRVLDEATGRQWLAPSWAQGRSMMVPFVDLLRGNPVGTFSNCFYRSASFIDALNRASTGYDWLVNLIVASTGGGLGMVGTASTLYRIHQRGTWSATSSEAKRTAVVDTLIAIREIVSGHDRLVVEDFLKREGNP